MFSIKKKLIFLVTGCTLFSAMLLGVISIVRITKISNRNSRDTLQLQCRATKESLDIIMGNVMQGVDSMKDIVLSEIGSVERLRSDDQYRNAFTNQMEQMNQTIAFHTKGAIAYYFWYNPDIFPVQDGYFWVYNQRYTRFFVKEVPDITLYTRYDIAMAGRFYLPADNGKATWIPPYFDAAIGLDVISYVVPVYVRGVLVGVLGMDIRHSVIADEVKDVSLYKTGYAVLLDEQDRAVYHKNYDPGDLVFIFKNDIQIFSLPLNNGWTLDVIVPKKEVNAERNLLILSLVMATLLVAGIFIFISTKITAKIINPLMELIAATRKLADGDLNVELPVKSDDEVGMLAKSFEETIERLPDYLYRDSLTGVRNATAYKRAVSDLETRLLNKEPLRFAVVVMDINNLKLVNDHYGHEAGNELITTASSLICDVFKHSPVYRIGGDEFVSILEWASYDEREELIAEFTRRLDRIAIFVEKLTLPVSVAVGMSEYDAQTDTVYDDIFNRADEAMYENKKFIKAQRNMPSR